MRKPIRTLSLPALLILSASCSKHSDGNPHQVYAGTYRSEPIMAVAQPVLYAKGFQTSNATFIQSFLQRNKGPENFWYSEPSVTIPDSFAVFNFRTGDSLDVTGAHEYTRSMLVGQTGHMAPSALVNSRIVLRTPSASRTFSIHGDLKQSRRTRSERNRCHEHERTGAAIAWP